MTPLDPAGVPAPCFVLEEARLRANLELLQRVQNESGAKVILALKGFALYHAFPLIRRYLPGTTASSLYEARLGHEEFGGEVHACAPVYPPHEIETLLGYVSHITFNSLSEWERHAPAVRACGGRVSAAIRVNPEHTEVATGLYNPGVPGSRLGVPAGELGDRLPDGVEGLHFHTLCECGADALERTLAALEARFGPLLEQARWLNLGGGHLVTRADYDVDLLIGLLRGLRERYDLAVILEPGAAVAWQTGVLVSTVLDRVEHRGVRTLMLDVSFAAHMPDCLEMPYKPRVRGARDPQPGETGWRLGGMTCLAGDSLGDYVFDAEPAVGDRLVFEDMMHYTLVKTTMFNGVPHPPVAIRRENGDLDVVRTFGYDDYRRRMG
jgi:carboxynorspermidine decarboxylase